MMPITPSATQFWVQFYQTMTPLAIHIQVWRLIMAVMCSVKGLFVVVHVSSTPLLAALPSVDML